MGFIGQQGRNKGIDTLIATPGRLLDHAGRRTIDLSRIEMLVLDDHLRTLIAKNTALPAVKTEARKKGMLYLQEVALHKVYEGITSINEVLRVTKERSSKPA